MAPFQTFATRLVRSVSLSAQTKHLEFEVPARPRFGFVAGQWLSFKTNKPDGEEITRAYSIASPPGEDNRLALCLNRVQDGFMSNFLCDMQEGEEISCQGPFGDFILRPPLRDTVFIATGTGMAPFRSMLHWRSQCSMERNGAIPVPVAMKMVSRSGGRRMKSPKGPWQVISSPSFMSQRKLDMKPSCTRLRQSAKRLSSPGGDAIE